MNELDDNELGYFVDSLSQHQRVFLQRLLGECLTSLPGGNDEITVDRLRLIGQNMLPLSALLNHLRTFSPSDDDSDLRPFALTFPQPGNALIKLSRRILTWPAIWEARSHTWLDDMRVKQVTIDLTHLEEVNSSTIAWMVTLAQHLSGGAVHLINVKPTIRRALIVLHLEKILLME